jgi:chromosome segregation ATPase
LQDRCAELSSSKEQISQLKSALTGKEDAFESLLGQLRVKDEERMDLMTKLQDVEQRLNVAEHEKMTVREASQMSAQPDADGE